MFKSVKMYLKHLVNILLVLLIVFVAVIHCSVDVLQQRCVDPECSEVISICKVEKSFDASALSPASSADVSFLTLKEGDEVRVRAKVDTPDDLWFGEIDSAHSGYFPKSHIREINVLNSELKYLVPIAISQQHEPNHKQHQSINKSAVNTQTEGDVIANDESVSSKDEITPNVDVDSSATTTTTTTANVTLNETISSNAILNANETSEASTELADELNSDEQMLNNEVSDDEKLKKAEQEQKLKEEIERLQKEQEEAERLLKEKEQKEEEERLQKEKEESERIQKEKQIEEERLKKEAEELERQRKEAEEQERLIKATEEQDRLKKEAEEQERLKKEAEEQERLKKEAEEQERLKKEAEEQERLKKEAEELERQRKDAEEQERLKKEAEENERLRKEAEEAEKERLRLEELERVRKEEEEAERVRLLLEQEQEKLKEAATKSQEEEAERVLKQQQEKERLDKEEEERLRKDREAFEAEYHRIMQQQQQKQQQQQNNNQINSDAYADSNQSQSEPELHSIDSHHHQIHEFSKYCADIRPLAHVFSHLQSLYSPLLVILPDSMQTLLLESTQIGGLSIATLSLIASFSLLIISSIVTVALKSDKRKKASNVTLNEAILNLELKIKTLSFEKDTFRTRIVELEEENGNQKAKNEQMAIELARKNDDKAALSALKNAMADSDRQITALREENARISDQFERQKQMYADSVTRVNNLESEAAIRDQQIKEFKEDVAANEAEIERLKKELQVKEKKISLLEMSLNQSAPSHLQTIQEDEPMKTTNGSGGKIGEMMDVAALHVKIESMQKQLQQADIDMQIGKSTREKLESEIESARKDYVKIKAVYDEKCTRIRDLEMELKVMGELRKKDLELNVKACSELDAQLKKKSSDAEKALHLLEQLKMKQERVSELEAQLARVEKKSMNERQQFDKQNHENWLTARRYEKEAKEAKQEAKLWKERVAELEKMRESSLIRPVALIRDQTDNGSDDSATAAVSLEERPPSVASNPPAMTNYAPYGVNNSPTPMIPPPLYMRNMYRGPFPPMPFPPSSASAMRMPTSPFTGDNRNTTLSPEILSQMMSRCAQMMPMMPPPMTSPRTVNNATPNMYSNSSSSMQNNINNMNVGHGSPFRPNNDSSSLVNNQSMNFDDAQMNSTMASENEAVSKLNETSNQSNESMSFV